MGKKRFLTLVSTILAIFLIVGCSSSDGLAIRLKAGDKVTFHAVTEMQMTMKNVAGIPGMPTELPGMDMKIEYDASLNVTEMAKDAATIAYEVTNMTGGVYQGGQLIQELPMDDTKITVKMNTVTGEILEITGLSNMSGDMKDQMNQMIKQSFAQLPATGKAKKGDTWEQKIAIPMNVPGMENNSEMTIKLTYEADETRGGVDVAKIKTNGTATFDMSGDLGAPMVMKGTMTSEGAQYLEKATGLPVEIEESGKATFKAESSADGQNLTMDIEMTIKTTLKRK